MFHDLEIIQVVDIKTHGQVIFARLIADSNLTIKEGSAINDIPLLPFLDIPRMIDEKGQQRLNVFAFRPVSQFPADHFQIGQMVRLFIPD
jgi:hypothetical protein